MTSKLIITRERLQELAAGQSGFNLRTATHEESQELASMALAAIDSEPVAWLWSRDGDDERDVSLTPPEVDDDAADAIECGWTATPLYRHAQPAPAVPDAYVRDERGRMMLNGVCEPKIGFGIGWNACRAAMLAAAQHDTPALNSVQSVVTMPGKWIPVSDRMPENDVPVLTFDGMYRRVHHAMYGHWQCWETEKITHWMPLPAAPQEVK
ncbi:TPA: DUF551 domain-containing protein [Klebsiella pneumoniae]|nr:DUF551 domain-containing protein [Klebsiella pneumoniae]